MHYLVQCIQQRQNMEVRNALQTPIESIILVDAVLDNIGSGTTGYYDHLCGRDINGNIKAGGFNETACAAMEVDTPACERLARRCVDSYDRHLCMYAKEFCEETVGKWFESEVALGKRNSYDDRKSCDGEPPLCDLLEGGFDKYLNQPHIQEALGFENFNYSGINYDMNTRFEDSGDIAMPTTREVSFILDETQTDVLLLNGNHDNILYVFPNVMYSTCLC